MVIVFITCMQTKQFFAQKAFIVHEGSVLLVRKSADDPSQAGKWEVPGGRMEFGEEVDAHLQREVREEVGLSITPGEPFAIWQWQMKRADASGEETYMQVVAVARICTTSDPTALDDSQRVAEDYLAETAWVPFAELLSYDLIPNMRGVVEKFLYLQRS